MILVNNKIVIAVMDSYEQMENGKLINGKVYPIGDVVEVEAPINVIPQKYCYTFKDGFYINPVWEQSVESEKQKAIDAYTQELIQGGLL